MPTKINLFIPEPCHQNWNEMTPTGAGRYCGSCRKVVVDFTSMSDAQLIAYFKQPKGATCGRFHADQLERDVIAPPKRMPWLKYFFQISLPAFLVSCRSNNTVGEMVVKKETATTASPLPVDTTIIASTTTATVGMVMPEMPMAEAAACENHISTIIIGDTTDITTNTSAMNDTLNLPTCKVLDEVTVNSNVNIRLGGFSTGLTVVKYSDTITSIVTQMRDTLLTKSFRIFPNPSFHGSEVKVNWNGLPVGNYRLQVASMNGQLLLQKDIGVAAKDDTFTLPLPELIPGTYLISFISPEIKKPFTQRLIVQ